MKLENVRKTMGLATMVAMLMISLVVMPKGASAGTVTGAQITLPDSGSSSFNGGLRVYVPFPFAVNGKTMNAGEYYINRDGEQFLAIKDGSGKNTVFVLTHNVTTTGEQATPKLVFHRYGDNYFLAQTWLSCSDAGRELSASSAERKLAKEYRQMKATLDVGR